MILNNVILPVINSSVSHSLLSRVIGILYIQPRTAREVPNCELYVLLSESLVVVRFVQTAMHIECPVREPAWGWELK